MNEVDNGNRVVVNAADRFGHSAPDYVHGATAPAHIPTAEPEPDPEPLDVEIVDDVRHADVPPRGSVVERVRHAVGTRVRRPTVLTLDQLVNRDRVRARYRRLGKRAARGTGTAALRVFTGAGVIVLFTGRSVGRWVWMPEQAALVKRMADEHGSDAGRALAARKDLGRSRSSRLGVLFAAAGAGTLTVKLTSAALLAEFAAVPSTGWVALGGGAAALCFAAGYQPGAIDGAEAPTGLAEGLRLSMSERAVGAAIAEAFAEYKVSGQVVKVRAYPWGWLVTAEVLTHLTEKHLRGLALALDTRRGGLLVNTVAESTRTRVFRLVMRDLLAVGQVPPPVQLAEHEDIHTPVALAERFDGEPFAPQLAGLHVVVIARTGAGKSTILHRLTEAEVQGGAVVGVIDLTGGAALKAWAPVTEPRLSSLTDNVRDAQTALSLAIAILADRKARLAPGTEWRSSRAEPPIRLVIDEYGLVAEVKALRELVEYLLVYGRQGDVVVRLANHRLTKDMMGSRKVASQAQVQILGAMDQADAVQLPKDVRESGVRPGDLQPATQNDPRDAGRAFVIGLDPVPFQVRFGPYRHGEAAQRAEALAKGRGRPVLSEADERAAREYLGQNDGVPEILLATYDAIASFGDRDPARASSSEIAAYLVRAGFEVTSSTVSNKLRQVLGDAYPEDRTVDTNLPEGNLKGWYLRDLDRGVEAWKRLQRERDGR